MCSVKVKFAVFPSVESLNEQVTGDDMRMSVSVRDDNDSSLKIRAVQIGMFLIDLIVWD